MGSARQRSTGLVDELQSSHRFTIGVLVSVLVLSLFTSGYLILVSQPRLTNYVELAREARDVHEAMLDQETGLRGWLATGDPIFLEPYTAGRAASAASVSGLLSDVKSSPDVTDGVVSMLLARQRWESWASEAAAMRVTPAQRTDGTLARFLLDGKELFDAYRERDLVSTSAIRDHRTQALTRQTEAMVAVLASYLVLLAATAAITMRRRRRLQAALLAPIEDLHMTISRIRTGDLSARTEPTTVPELAEIGNALGELAATLEEAEVAATDREIRLAFLANRFETVVRVGREIAGSLSIRYVSSTVTTAAAELLGTTTTLWLRGEDQGFHAVHRSTDAHGAPAPSTLVPPAVVLSAATGAVPVSTDSRRAYPLVLAGTVTAVLQVETPVVDDDTDQVLVSLLSTAAAALESAHLHSTARELADMDGLTHLPNRRRFEIDIDTEWERCRRYGRPMSLIMMDLDHFKRLNDEHGHLLGDQVLREVATAVNGVLRSTDTAYRYGGEEIVVLLRETGLEDAALAAERLREAVSVIRVVEHPQVTVSTSAGVAARHASMSHYTGLVSKADKALYEAKRLGRNRVAVDGDGGLGETLFRGSPGPSPVTPT
ncbi:diguanylate cyclase [Nocardioides panacis]|uniref:Diguanylate cyclase n=1 Tax=Nocardioides panacis TaxID=2849501 RepID=A0A975SXH5_9ACTN|nr:diguanylate cyclase [Nocardioides panacis]QWZ07666.1 diguanylate cyclase [Nocardioides panacis]